MEVIFPNRERTEREKGEASHHWVTELHETFFDFNDEKFAKVTHVIGLVPTTAKAAVEIKMKWEEDSRKRDSSNVREVKVRCPLTRGGIF